MNIGMTKEEYIKAQEMFPDVDWTKEFPREMLVTDNLKGLKTKALVHGIFPNRLNKWKVITDKDSFVYAKELPTTKKMTVAELEEELGYSIEIVK